MWNATNLIPQLREQPIALFEEYGASAKTVFLETEWDEGLRHNKSRKAAGAPARDRADAGAADPAGEPRERNRPVADRVNRGLAAGKKYI